MTDNNELIQLLKRRLSNKLFSGSPTIEESGKRFEDASANAGGVGMACFSSSREQEAAFQKAWKREALTAGPYIYALETELLKSLTPLPSPPVSGEAVALYQLELENGEIEHLSGCFAGVSEIDGVRVVKSTPLYTSPLTNEPVWLGMTDAPRDGTAILGDVDGSAFVVWWDKMHSGWVSGHTDADDELYTRDVNGWMPLPTPQQGDSAAIGERN